MRIILTTPKTITPKIANLCTALVGSGAQPVFVPVQPVKHEIDDCYGAVETTVGTSGGAIVYGWNVMEWPFTLLEAQFHAVWQTLTGNLVDVSPKEDGETRILFLPDPGRRFLGKRIDSHYVALRDDPQITEFISLNKSKVHLEPEGGGNFVPTEQYLRIRNRIAEIIPHLDRKAAVRAKSRPRQR